MPGQVDVGPVVVERVDITDEGIGDILNDGMAQGESTSANDKELLLEQADDQEQADGVEEPDLSAAKAQGREAQGREPSEVEAREMKMIERRLKRGWIPDERGAWRDENTGRHYVIQRDEKQGQDLLSKLGTAAYGFARQPVHRATNAAFDYIRRAKALQIKSVGDRMEEKLSPSNRNRGSNRAGSPAGRSPASKERAALTDEKERKKHYRRFRKKFPPSLHVKMHLQEIDVEVVAENEHFYASQYSVVIESDLKTIVLNLEGMPRLTHEDDHYAMTHGDDAYRKHTLRSGTWDADEDLDVPVYCPSSTLVISLRPRPEHRKPFNEEKSTLDDYGPPIGVIHLPVLSFFRDSKPLSLCYHCEQEEEIPVAWYEFYPARYEPSGQAFASGMVKSEKLICYLKASFTIRLETKSLALLYLREQVPQHRPDQLESFQDIYRRSMHLTTDAKTVLQTFHKHALWLRATDVFPHVDVCYCTLFKTLLQRNIGYMILYLFMPWEFYPFSLCFVFFFVSYGGRLANEIWFSDDEWTEASRQQEDSPGWIPNPEIADRADARWSIWRIDRRDKVTAGQWQNLNLLTMDDQLPLGLARAFSISVEKIIAALRWDDPVASTITGLACLCCSFLLSLSLWLVRFYNLYDIVDWMVRCWMVVLHILVLYLVIEYRMVQEWVSAGTGALIAESEEEEEETDQKKESSFGPDGDNTATTNGIGVDGATIRPFENTESQGQIPNRKPNKSRKECSVCTLSTWPNASNVFTSWCARFLWRAFVGIRGFVCRIPDWHISGKRYLAFSQREDEDTAKRDLYIDTRLHYSLKED